MVLVSVGSDGTGFCDALGSIVPIGTDERLRPGWNGEILHSLQNEDVVIAEANARDRVCDVSIYFHHNPCHRCFPV
jgi:deoxycytidylate deaminase